MKLNFIASSQRTNTCCGQHCLQSKCATSFSCPLKVIDILINNYVFLFEPQALVFQKYSTTSLAFTMSFATTQMFFLSWNYCHFTKYYFHFFLWFPHLRMSSTSYCKWSPTRSGGGLITCLQLGHNVTSLNNFNTRYMKCPMHFDLGR